MFQIDTSGSVANMPVPVSLPGAAPGWFAQVNPSNPVGTVVSADWLNALQSELINTVVAAGLTPSKSLDNQLLTAINTLITRSARIKLTAPITLYVNPSGNDTNAGTTPAAPFQTIQGAYYRLMTGYDPNGQAATIQLANGTYPQGLSAGVPNGLFSSITLLGNPTSPNLVTISTTSGACIALSFGAFLHINGMTLTSGGGVSSTFSGGGVGIQCYFNSIASISNIIFGACGGAHMFASICSTITVPATTADQIPYTISGSAAYHAVSSAGCVVSIQGAAITLTGTPAFTAFVIAENGGYLSFNSTSFTGSATGSRYSATINGMIVGTGGVSTYFPGSTAGSTSNGGLYV